MPNLFKIIKQGKVSYLYGTCHVNNDAVCTLSEETKQAFEQSSCIAVEMTSEEQDKLQDYLTSKVEEWKKKNMVGSEESVTDYLSIAQTKKIADIFKDELSVAHPSHEALFQLLDTSPISLCQKINIKQMDNLGFLDSNLDKQIENQAKLVRKPIISLDTPEDLAQRIVGFSFTYKEQVEYARHFFAKQLTANNQEEIKKICLQIIPLYLAGDQEELKKLVTLNIESPIHKSHLLQSLVAERDQIFVQAMQSYLEIGNTFFAIGTMHIPGALSLLEKYGCVIEPVQEGNRLYKVQTLKNTNISLKKKNLLTDFQHFMQRKGNSSLFFDNTNMEFEIGQNELQIFLELIREGVINRNQKIYIWSGDSYNNEELLIINAILKERNAPKTINLNLMRNSSEENIVTISEIFRSESYVEELKINFNPYEKISERGIQCLIEALKTRAYIGKLYLSMANMEWNCPFCPELYSLIKSQNEVHSSFS